MKTVEEIWDDDLFDRKAEAEQLLGFIETMAQRRSLREDAHGYVLAVDGPYGQGKSFFLRRFASHMALTHPVAFVDAWTDDLEDEPLVALAATLDEALMPFADKSAALRESIAIFKAKAGSVAKIVAVGLAKRLGSLLIMGSGAEAIHHVIDSKVDLTSDLGKDVLKKSADGVVDGIATGAAAIVSGTMEERIENFRAGQAAVREMKAALSAIVEHLGQDDIYPPPVVVVIDELDRCRPTYAIKLLEEIKHLFDVPGVVFVLGMHGNALAHSVSAAYGAQFDGVSYLRRFFNKIYNLRNFHLYPLVQWIFRQCDIAVTHLHCPPILDGDRQKDMADPANMLALYMEMYGFTARDVFSVVDALETSLALIGARPLLVPLFLPLLLANARGSDELLEPVRQPKWTLVETDRFGHDIGKMSPDLLARQLLDLSRLDDQGLMAAVNKEDAGFAAKLISGFAFNGQSHVRRLDRPQDYLRLLRTVDRFVSPN